MRLGAASRSRGWHEDSAHCCLWRDGVRVGHATVGACMGDAGRVVVRAVIARGACAPRARSHRQPHFCFTLQTPVDPVNLDTAARMVLYLVRRSVRHGYGKCFVFIDPQGHVYVIGEIHGALDDWLMQHGDDLLGCYYVPLRVGRVADNRKCMQAHHEGILADIEDWWKGH